MANGAIDQAVIDEQFLQCSICVDRFVEPKVLPKCGHIFCRRCLDGVLRANGDEMLICPICRTDNTGCVRGGDINRLPDSHLAKSLIELVNTPILQQAKDSKVQETIPTETKPVESRTPSSRRKLHLPNLFNRKRRTSSDSNVVFLHQYMCPVCATDFQDRDSLHSHVELCLSRNAAFLESNTPSFGPHHSRRDSAQTYTCPVCQLQCTDESALQYHVEECLQYSQTSQRYTEDSTLYTCPICFLNFQDENILHVHVDTCLSDENLLPMNQHSQHANVNNAHDLTNHAASPSSTRESYLCPSCENTFATNDELAEHTHQCGSGGHGQNRENVVESDSDALDELQRQENAIEDAGNIVDLGDFELNTCPTCRATFSDSACYLSHMTMCIPENTVLLSTNDVLVDVNSSNGQTSEQWFECQKCNVPFLDIETFNSHESSCNGLRLRRRKMCTIL